MDHFKLVSDCRPSGDQSTAIEGMVNGVNWGLRWRISYPTKLSCRKVSKTALFIRENAAFWTK